MPLTGIICSQYLVPAKSQIVGLELELRASPWEGGYVSADVAYIENEYDEYQYVDPGNPGQVVDLSNVLISDFTPDWTVNAAVEHDFTLGNGSTLTPRAVVYWQTEYEWASTTGDWEDGLPEEFRTTVPGHAPSHGD